jgi:hypothetical protein
MAILAVLLSALPLSSDEPKLADLSAEASQLKQAFNGAKGDVRMILIVSPG